MNRLFHTALAAALQGLRRIPACRGLDDQRYDRIEAWLNVEGPKGLPERAASLALIPHVIRQSIAHRSEYRLIDPRHMNERDRQFLAEHQVDPEFVAANRSGISPQDYPEKPPHRETHSPTSDFQLDAFASGNITAVCPFSGKLLRSQRSILAAEGNPIFYRFEGTRTFYLAVGRPGIGYGKLYFYFPQFQAIVLLRNKCFWHGRNEVDRLRSYMIANWRDVARYFSTTQLPSICALVDCEHFAHHLWNDLTGIDKLLSADGTQHINKLIVAAEPLGPIDDIFPALTAVTIERLETPKLFRQILHDNWLLIRPGDNHISERVIKGLCKTANAHCQQDVRDEARRLRQNHWPILWVTVRTGNRTWVSQCSAIPHLANDLLERFPGLAIIIDGFCTPCGRSAVDKKEQKRAIAEEMACIREIRERLNSTIPIHVNVGRPLTESIVFAAIADCYLAHHGSLQHKISWVGNCPGVVHSNTDDLRGGYGRHRALRARDNPVVARLLNPSAITDIAGARPKEDSRWEDHIGNYDFDYHVALQELTDILRDIAAERPSCHIASDAPEPPSEAHLGAPHN